MLCECGQLPVSRNVEYPDGWQDVMCDACYVLYCEQWDVEYQGRRLTYKEAYELNLKILADAASAAPADPDFKPVVPRVVRHREPLPSAFEREREVAILLDAYGPKSSKGIAEAIGLSQETVRLYLRRMKKRGVLEPVPSGYHHQQYRAVGVWASVYAAPPSHT